MQQSDIKYDVAIIGGGLAGLSLSILLNRLGYNVVLFEKEKFPFHKVCGEYISNESWNFLKALGIPLQEMQLPQIDTLQLTSHSGTCFTTRLPLGGFGISRYTLDHMLAQIAKREGVAIYEETKVHKVDFSDGTATLQISTKSANILEIKAEMVCGSYGKRSNLDVKWGRDFIKQKPTRLSNYIAIKYHIQTDWPTQTIGLHNFNGGYCGISKIDGDSYCLCYLTTAACLKAHNSIPKMEEQVLYKNPALKKIFRNSKVLPDFPLTISQISFDKKTQVEKGVLMLGDAAGMITPLCGNGMSIALHSSKLAAFLIHQYLSGKIKREQMEYSYQKQWYFHFASRLRMGRVLQPFFGLPAISDLFVKVFDFLPFLAAPVIRQTHGKPF